MSKLKFQNVHGREGSFTVNKRKYSFFNGVFEIKKDDKDLVKDDKDLVKFFKESSAWINYIPTAEDKIKDYSAEIEKLKLENEELQNLLDEVTSDGKSDKKDTSELVKNSFEKK